MKMDKAARGASHTIKQLKHFGVEGEVVMDIGANVGHVSRWLQDNGAKRVVSYEPHPGAFAQLKERCPDCELINAALLTKAGTATIATSQKDADAGYFCNASMTSALPVKTEVDVLSFPAELRRVKPTAIKMDVEGSEYDMLLNTRLVKRIKWVSMEVHKLNNPTGPYLFAALAVRMFSSGYGMYPLQPSCRPAPGVCKSFWGFMQVDFARGHRTREEDAEWIASVVKRGWREKDTIKTRIKSLQDLFDKEYKS
jgi:FkbM family methyltransferase